MKNNLKTFPLKASFVAMQWKIDFEKELREIRRKLASRGYDGIDLVVLDTILGDE